MSFVGTLRTDFCLPISAKYRRKGQHNEKYPCNKAGTWSLHGNSPIFCCEITCGLPYNPEAIVWCLRSRCAISLACLLDFSWEDLSSPE